MYRTERKTGLFPLSIFAEELNLTGPDPTLTEGNGTEETAQPAGLLVPNQARFGSLRTDPEGRTLSTAGELQAEGIQCSLYYVHLMLLLNVFPMSLEEPVFYVLKTYTSSTSRPLPLHQRF